MGKLSSPRSPPSGTASPSFPRMEPPPPYEAASSRSSSAHSNDRLQGGEPSQSQGVRQENVPERQQETRQEQRPETQSETSKANQHKTEDGCCTFGNGASGCMVYGDHAEGRSIRAPSVVERKAAQMIVQWSILININYQAA